MKHTNKILLDKNGEDRIVYDGKILDDYNCPIDNQFEVDKLFEIFIIGDDKLAYNSRFYLSAKELGFVKNYEAFKNEKDNFIFMDNVYSLESVGRTYFIMNLKPELKNFEIFEKYINFKKIGEDLFFDNLTSCGFSAYGFILHH